MNILLKLFQVAAIGILGTIAMAFVLAILPRRVRAHGSGLKFPLAGRESYTDPDHRVTTRDASVLCYRRFAADDSRPIVVMLHGSGWHGYQFADLGARIAGAGLATCLAPDIRGHGANPDRRGDCGYIGHLEDDIADLVAAEVADGPTRPVIILGHSSGGSLAIRYAGGGRGPAADGTILLAPFVHHAAPTQRPNSGGWADPFLRRLVGLSILNAFRIRVLNHLMVIRFRFPAHVRDGALGHTITERYSYRLNISYSARQDYKSDISKLPPFLLITGEDDEAFYSDRFAGLFAESGASGDTHVIAGAGHLDIVDHEATFGLIAAYLGRFGER